MNMKHYYNLLKMIDAHSDMQSIINYAARHNISANDFQDSNEIGADFYTGTESEKWEQILTAVNNK